MEVNPV